MTGRYPHRNGMQTPFCGGMAEGTRPLFRVHSRKEASKVKLPHRARCQAHHSRPSDDLSPSTGLNLNETLMSEYMNRAGYTSRIVGKWHLG